MKKLIILSVLVLALAACGKNSDSKEDVGLSLPSVSGKTWVFQDHNKNQPVLVAFMATFCGYCKQMAPLIDELAAKYNDKGVEVAIVFTDADPAAAKSFVQAQNIKNATVLYEGEEFARIMGVRAFPQMFLFDHGSADVGTWRGFDPEYIKVISGQIDTMLARPAVPSADAPSTSA